MASYSGYRVGWLSRFWSRCDLDANVSLVRVMTVGGSPQEASLRGLLRASSNLKDVPHTTKRGNNSVSIYALTDEIFRVCA